MVRDMLWLCAPACFLPSMLDTIVTSRQQTVHNMLVLLSASSCTQGKDTPGSAGSLQAQLCVFITETCITPQGHCCCVRRAPEGKRNSQWDAAIRAAQVLQQRSGADERLCSALAAHLRQRHCVRGGLCRQ